MTGIYHIMIKICRFYTSSSYLLHWFPIMSDTIIFLHVLVYSDTSICSIGPLLSMCVCEKFKLRLTSLWPRGTGNSKHDFFFFFFVTARLHWPKLWLNLTSKWPKGLRRTGYSRHGFSTDVRIATGCQILDGVLQLCSHPAHVETKPCFSHTWKWHQNRLREMTYLASSLDRRHRYGHWLHAVLDTAWSRLVSSENYKAAWTHFLWGKLRSRKKMFHYCYHCKERIRGVRSNNNDTFYIALYPCKWAHALYYIRNTEIGQIKNLYKSTEKLFF